MLQEMIFSKVGVSNYYFWSRWLYSQISFFANKSVKDLLADSKALFSKHKISASSRPPKKIASTHA